MDATAYVIKLNGHTANHATYETAAAAWERVVSAVEDGRSIDAELWRHNRYDWDESFYQGLLDPVTHEIDTEMFTVIQGKLILSRQCIAALLYP